MGLTDEVIMKGSEYEALCDKMRELTGKTDKFTSSQLLEELSNVISSLLPSPPTCYREANRLLELEGLLQRSIYSTVF